MTITFIECQKKGYKARTEENILRTDGTIAFAIDLKTGGEICTHNLCVKHNKPYLGIQLLDLTSESITSRVSKFLNKNNINCLNIAGNGIYTFVKFYPHKNPKSIQNHLNQLIYYILKSSAQTIETIYSGTQTGIDEAAIIAGLCLNINCFSVAPKGWMFRDHLGYDICDEEKYKERFNLETIQDLKKNA